VMTGNIQIISAPSILGLRPTGVEKLSTSLLSNGLAEKAGIVSPVIEAPDLNGQYDPKRDAETQCLNTDLIVQFSKSLAPLVQSTVKDKSFALVPGGDCSILIGVMAGLKPLGKFGLLFIDAHADFYSPETSITGEVADMDLAIVCGRGPDALTNIDGLQPYVEEKHVIHMGQRDQEETVIHHSPDIAKTEIKRFDLQTVSKNGIGRTLTDILNYVANMNVDGFWIHFDTDSLSDEINPAVDYRLPGGLKFDEVELICGTMMETGQVVGMSVTCFNPTLDRDGMISKNITESLGRMLDHVKHAEALT
jgi:arginase